MQPTDGTGYRVQGARCRVQPTEGANPNHDTNDEEDLAKSIGARIQETSNEDTQGPDPS